MRKRKLLLLALILITIAAAIAIYVSVLYFRGDVSNYAPPQPPSASSQERAQSDLQSLSQAVDAYFIKNMEYPKSLDLLQPEFVERVVSDPLSGKPYVYTLSETDGVNRYRISVPNPQLYNAKEFYIEDGRLFQN
jgi:hypothetical protein